MNVVSVSMSIANIGVAVVPSRDHGRIITVR